LPVRKIAYLVPGYSEKRSYLGGEASPGHLAQWVTESSGGSLVVEIITCGQPARQEELAAGITLRVLPAACGSPDPLNLVSWELPAALEEVDLVHLFQPFCRFGDVALLVARQQRKAVCATDASGLARSLLRSVNTLDLVDLLICPSDHAALSLGKESRQTAVTVITGGIDTKSFQPPPKPVRRNRIAYVGPLLPHRGIDQLLLALPYQVPLTVCGPCLDKDYLRGLQRLAAGKQVEFRLDADEALVRELYYSSWANVLPLLQPDGPADGHWPAEWLSTSLLGAMACGTPVLCSKVGSLPEFVRPGQTGFVFDDPAMLTEQIRLLARSPDLVEAQGRQARLAVEQEFSHHVLGAKLCQTYEDVLRENTRAAA
jgi:hypothetical protein